MNHLCDPPAPDHLEAALEATCDALSVLQVIDAQVVQHGWVKAQNGHAIESLRRAILELRAARGTEESALALGFVAEPTGQRH